MSAPAPVRSKVHGSVLWVLLLILATATRLVTGIEGGEETARSIEWRAFPESPVYTGLGHLAESLGLTPDLFISIIGGLATFVLLYFGIRLIRSHVTTSEGWIFLLLLLFNPVIWIFGNRLSPSLAGVSILVGVIVLLLRRRQSSEREYQSGMFLSGLLLGIAPFYLPLILFALIVTMIRSHRRVAALIGLMIGIGVWLLPVIATSGWEEYERGVVAEFTPDRATELWSDPTIDVRRVSFLEGTVIDGFGGSTDVGNPLGMFLLIGVAVLFARGMWWLFFRETDGLLITLLSISLYIAWVIIYERALYRPEYILPLVPLMFAVVWRGIVQLWYTSTLWRVLVLLFISAYSCMGIASALQGQLPSEMSALATKELLFVESLAR